MTRRAVSTTLPEDVDAALDTFCLANGMSRSAGVRMAVDAFLMHVSSPWWAGYAEGFRGAQNDLQPSIDKLLAKLREASAAASEYADDVRAQTVRRKA